MGPAGHPGDDRDPSLLYPTLTNSGDSRLLLRCHRSWGPLGILVTTEIQPLETRSASQSVSVVNFTFWQFVITQTYLSMLCTLRWGVFVFFGGEQHAIRHVPNTKHNLRAPSHICALEPVRGRSPGSLFCFETAYWSAMPANVLGVETRLLQSFARATGVREC